MLVLSHSLGVNLTMWEPQLDALGSHFHLLLYDTRGHGQSSVPTGPYSIRELGEDVLMLMDSLSIQTTSFCGLSMGGVIGQWLGIHAGNRLDKLVLSNTSAKIGNAEGWDGRIAIVDQQGLEPVIDGTLERWFTADFRAVNGESVEATRAMLQATQAAGYMGCCGAIRDVDFRAELRTISAPTLIICGTHDPVTTVEDGRFMAERIAGSMLIELPAAHLSSVEAANEFNEALLRFLTA
jgi:3-oxoadipate enol-lactonase